MPENATVAEVCKALANARSDAALLTGTGGGMTGIVTAIDLTRYVRTCSVRCFTTKGLMLVVSDLSKGGRNDRITYRIPGSILASYVATTTVPRIGAKAIKYFTVF